MVVASFVLALISFLFPNIEENVREIIKIIFIIISSISVFIFMIYGIFSTWRQFAKDIESKRQKVLDQLKDENKNLREEVKKIKEQESYDAEEVYICSRNTHNIFYLKKSIHLNLGDNGSAETVNNCEVQAVTSGIKIINFIATGTSSDIIKSDYKLKVSMKEQYNSSPGTIIRLGNTDYDERNRKLTYNIVFDPELSIKHSIEFKHKIFYPNSTFAIKKDFLEKGLNNEFFAHKISQPTKTLHLEADFSKLNFDNFWTEFDVWYDTINKIRHKKEYDRIDEINNDKIELDQSGKRIEKIKIDIPYPLVGITYIICWSVPD